MEDDDAPGVPEWVVTYGDMMSLLLTFFIMLVSLSEVVADKKYRAMLESIRSYVGYQNTPRTPPGQRFPLNEARQRLATLGSFLSAQKGSGGIRSESAVGPEFRVYRSREGRPLRVGEALAITAQELPPATVAELDRIAESVVGKPNKVELLTLIMESSHESRRVGFARLARVAEELKGRGVEQDRLRLTVRVADPDELEVGRVAVQVLDARRSDYVGPRKPMTHRPGDLVPSPVPIP